jgi:ubiquinone/menaquinone biosynthesis C-methylase UbiE
MANPYRSLVPLMKLKSPLTDVKHFHDCVNKIFHDQEARYYDKIHDEMWKSLPAQFDLIVKDMPEQIKEKKDLRLLDVGCGTGLATAFLLNTSLGKNINEIHLLDTSLQMLLKAKKKAKGWGKNFKLINGEISNTEDNYDVILISSVLHHIPDIPTFLGEISRVQNDQGVLITVHDPAKESIESDLYKNRCQEYRNHQASNVKKRPISARIFNRVRRMLTRTDYIDKINRQLLNDHIIKESLTEVELWSITDIHVEGLPYSASNGISRQLLSDHLPRYSLKSYRTYCFYGLLTSHLDNRYQHFEQELILKHDLYGRNFSSLWIKERT